MKLSLNTILITNSWEYILLLIILIYFIFTQLILISEELSPNANLKVIPMELISLLNKTNSILKFGKYAYVQYATDLDYLNLAIINFIVLRRTSTQISNLVVLFNRLLEKDKTRFNGLKTLAQQYLVTLKPVSIIESHDAESLTWSKSFTKFHIFNEVDYDRIVYFDADSMLLHNQYNKSSTSLYNVPENLDELFSILDIVDIALPQAYWLTNYTKASKKINVPDRQEYQGMISELVDEVAKSFNDSLIFEKLPGLHLKDQKQNHRKDFFATHVMVIKPSTKTFDELNLYVHNPWFWSFMRRHSLRDKSDYDMEVLNKFIDDTLQGNELFKVGILPHKVYGVLTGEFREPLHTAFISEPQFLPFVTNESKDQWQPTEIIRNIKLIHFSDSPIPKPWQDMNSLGFYDAFRIYCNDDDFDERLYNERFPTQWKPKLTTDCESVNIWNWFMEEHQKLRNEFWI